MKTFSDIAVLFRQMGALRSTLFMGGMVAVIGTFTAIFVMLADSVGWPEAYGFRCRRKCLFEHMWHSPKLLAGGSGEELALFALIWFLPLVLAAITIPTVFRRWVNRRKERIRPIQSD